MFSIDFPEIIIIFAVALVVLGPKKLPGAAAKIGRWVGRARSMARQFREQLEQEVSSAENAIDIRQEVDSAGEPTPKQPSRDTGATAQAESTPPAEGHPPVPESVPPEAVTHGASASEGAPHEAMPYEPTPYHSMPEHAMPPPEGYGPSPQQLSFDEQLHDTALPPEEAPVTHARDWMPETQTWMANAGWESPQPNGSEPARSNTGSAPPEDAGRPPRTGGAEDQAEHPDETMEHHDR